MQSSYRIDLNSEFISHMVISQKPLNIFLLCSDLCWERGRTVRRRIKWMTTSRGCDWSTSIFRECELICFVKLLRQWVSRQIVSAPLPPPIVRWELTDFLSTTFCKIFPLHFPPHRVSCEQCILQWTYTAGNNWGTCANGTGSLGCGPQVRGK